MSDGEDVTALRLGLEQSFVQFNAPSQWSIQLTVVNILQDYDDLLRACSLEYVSSVSHD